VDANRLKPSVDLSRNEATWYSARKDNTWHTLCVIGAEKMSSVDAPLSLAVLTEEWPYILGS
jgi:hypothetical protein